jgi:hypothetical protein
MTSVDKIVGPKRAPAEEGGLRPSPSTITPYYRRHIDIGYRYSHLCLLDTDDSGEVIEEREVGAYLGLCYPLAISRGR